MSLAVAFKGPEGIVLAADSRVTMQVQQVPVVAPGSPPGRVTIIPTYFDNAHKLLDIKGQPYVGIVTYGTEALGAELRTAHSSLPEFEAQLTIVAGLDSDGVQNRLTTHKISGLLRVWLTSNL